MERYKILKIIGKGGFGVVFKVYDNEFKRLTVVKKIKKQGGDLNEVKIMKKLGDVCTKYFVCYYDYEENYEEIIIFMEWLPGYIVLTKLSSINNEQLCTLYTNIANGLKLLHDEGIAHEDIKTDNIMVNPKTMDIKIIDYGAACYKDDCKKQDIGFTYPYLDPKIYKLMQYNHIRSLDGFQQADLWSLGIIFYQLITGAYPINQYPPTKEGTHTYFMKYKYSKDPARNKINKTLDNLDCKISLDNLLSLDVRRKYFI